MWLTLYHGAALGQTLQTIPLGFRSYFTLIGDPIDIRVSGAGILCAQSYTAPLAFYPNIKSFGPGARGHVERLRSGELRESLAGPCCGRFALFLHIFLPWLNLLG